MGTFRWIGNKKCPQIPAERYFKIEKLINRSYPWWPNHDFQSIRSSRYAGPWRIVQTLVICRSLKAVWEICDTHRFCDLSADLCRTGSGNSGKEISREWGKGDHNRHRCQSGDFAGYSGAIIGIFTQVLWSHCGRHISGYTGSHDIPSGAASGWGNSFLGFFSLYPGASFNDCSCARVLCLGQSNHAADKPWTVDRVLHCRIHYFDPFLPS